MGRLKERTPLRCAPSARKSWWERDAIRIKTYADVLAAYQSNPEPKSLGPDGLPCHRATVGLLVRRPVRAGPIRYIGKETNRLEEREAGLVHNLDDILLSYTDPKENPWSTIIVPVLQTMSAATIAKRSKLNRTTIERMLSGKASPRSTHKARLIAVAEDVATKALHRWKVPLPKDALTRCVVFLQERDRRGGARTCTISGKAITGGALKTYCSERCKKRAYRKRMRKQLAR